MPFFIRWPAGTKQPGRQWDKSVGQVDLLATFADLLGTQLPDSACEDSQSFASVLTNPNADHVRRALINHGIRGRFAVTEGNWKLIMPHRVAMIELYDLASDPGEEKNVSARYPVHVNRLEEQLTDIVLNGRTTGGAAQTNDTGYWKDLTWITEKQYDAAKAGKKH